MLGFLFKPVKEAYNSIGISVLGSYFLKSASLRNWRVGIYFLTIFVLTLILFFIFNDGFISWIVSFAPILLLIAILFLVAIPIIKNRWTKSIEKIKEDANLDKDEKTRKLLIKLIQMIYLFLLCVMVSSFLFGLLLSSLIILGIERMENNLLSHLLIEYSAATWLVPVSIMFILASYMGLFYQEKKIRNFPKIKSKLNFFQSLLSNSLYLTIGLITGLMEAILILPFKFMKQEETYTGCITGKVAVSLIGKERHLQRYKITHVLSVKNPDFIKILNGADEITFYYEETTGAELTDFGDYFILHGKNEQIIKKLEQLINKHAVVSGRRWRI